MRFPTSPFRALVVVGALAVSVLAAAARPAKDDTLTVVVMDPLADKIACACVKGYANRLYGNLGKFLETKLGRLVRVVYAENLDRALDEVSAGSIDLIIGKQSLVKFDAKECKIPVRPLCLLNGLDGTTNLTGWFVVKKNDPAKKIADLKGRKILFGMEDSVEKNTVAFEALKAAGVPLPKKIETRTGCSDSALEILDSKAKLPPVGVISSYAFPLLEGCGSIPKGALRLIGKTKPVPFITVFATGRLQDFQTQPILDALYEVKNDPALLKVMESKGGFVPISSPPPPTAPPADTDTTSADWPGWRGLNRDGIAAWLPLTLPAKPTVLWKAVLSAPTPGHGGIAAAHGYVIVGDRDASDKNDVFRCYKADSGVLAWQITYAAEGKLDYGNGPRTTPQIAGDKVYLLGAFGQLNCVELETGKVVWKKDLVADFGAKLPNWGYASSPLVEGENLIVNPGAPNASVVALDRKTGEVVWKTPGNPAAYASFILAKLGGVDQLVGYDDKSLGGWDAKSGKRLWTLLPPNTGDFNVPTPIAYDGKLVACSENNGTRLYGFGADGTIIDKPLGVYTDLSPDMVTPVVVAGKLYCARSGMYCLDIAQNLKRLWNANDPDFDSFATLIGSPDRMLVVTGEGNAVLIKVADAGLDVISKMKVFTTEATVFSHPAIAGKKLFIRDDTSIICISLKK